MSLFRNCMFCPNTAETVCNCSESPKFFCYKHTGDHMSSGGSHFLKEASIRLSSEETNAIQKAHRTYKIQSSKNAIDKKNQIVHQLLVQIRKSEEECASFIKNLHKEEGKEMIEICSKQAIPLFCNISMIDFLISLKRSSEFTEDNIIKHLMNINPYPETENIPSILKIVPPKPKIIVSKTQYVPSNSQSVPSETDFAPKAILSSPKTNPIAPTTESIPQWHLHNKFQAHKSEITSIAISYCERFFASGSRDNTIKVWNSETLKLIDTLEGHTNWVNSIAFLADMIVSGSQDTTVKIWRGNRCIKSLNNHNDKVMSVCASSSGSLIASGGMDYKIILYDVGSDRVIRTIREHSDTVYSVIFSKSNRELISGSYDRTVKVWNTETGILLNTLSGHSKTITCVNSFENFILSSSFDTTINIYEATRSTAFRTLTGHSSSVVKIEVWNNLLASLGEDNSIKIWDIPTGKEIQTLEGHGSYSGWWMAGLKFSNEGHTLISGGRDRNIKIWKFY